MSKIYDKYTDFIFVCTGKDCKKAGSKDLKKSFAMELQNKGLNKSVKMIDCKCTDRCKEAPVAIVNNHWQGNVSNDQISELIAKHIK